MSDRLSALLQRFELRARVFHQGRLLGLPPLLGASGASHLHLLRSGTLVITDSSGSQRLLNGPHLIFMPRPAEHRLQGDGPDGAELVCAEVDFGAGDENPLLRGLPTLLQVPLSQLPGLDLAQQLLFGEAAASRCGHDAVVNRLAEVLVIQLLRHAMAQRLVDGGVMAGLADARLAKALSAVHAEPARRWTLDTLAATAGMSRARFAAHFAATVGVPPGDYLAGWRLGLARALLRQGLQVKQVAQEVGYASPSALSRAFGQRLGTTPAAWQRREAGVAS